MSQNYGGPEIFGTVVLIAILYGFVQLVGVGLTSIGEKTCSRYGNIEFSLLQGCKIYVEGKGYIPEQVYLRQYDQNINIKNK